MIVTINDRQEDLEITVDGELDEVMEFMDNYGPRFVPNETTVDEHFDTRPIDSAPDEVIVIYPEWLAEALANSPFGPVATGLVTPVNVDQVHEPAYAGDIESEYLAGDYYPHYF